MQTTWEEKERKTHEDVERYLGGGPGVCTPDLAGSKRTGAEPRSLEEAGHRPMHLQGVMGICIRLSEIQNGFPGPKALFSHACLFMQCKIFRNLPDRTKFYRTCPLVLRISESLLSNAMLCIRHIASLNVIYSHHTSLPYFVNAIN